MFGLRLVLLLLVSFFFQSCELNNITKIALRLLRPNLVPSPAASPSGRPEGEVVLPRQDSEAEILQEMIRVVLVPKEIELSFFLVG